MPFRPINFANIAPIGSPSSRNFAADLMRGFKLGEEPFNEAARIKSAAGNRKARALQNELLKIKSQYLPKQIESKLNSEALSRAKSSLLSENLSQQLKDKHMKALASVYKALAPPKKGVSTGFDAQGRPVVSFGGPSQSGQRGVPRELAEYLGETLKSTPGRETDSAGTPPAYQANLMTGTGRGAQGKQFVGLGGDTFTPYSTAALSLMQRQNVAIEKLVPLVSNLKNLMKGETTLGFTLNPNTIAKKEALVSQAVEKVLKAQGLTSTEEGVKLSRAQLEPGKGETNKNYLKRLGALTKDYLRQHDVNLKNIREGGVRTTANGTPSNKSASQMNMNELIKLATGQ